MFSPTSRTMLRHMTRKNIGSKLPPFPVLARTRAKREKVVTSEPELRQYTEKEIKDIVEQQMNVALIQFIEELKRAKKVSDEEQKLIDFGFKLVMYPLVLSVWVAVVVSIDTLHDEITKGPPSSSH